jgi:dihydrofolate reductase
MAKLVYAMNMSLDGYVDHMKMGPPDPAAFRHFIEKERNATGMIYGGTMYDIMRYWDETRPTDDDIDHEFAAVWRSKPKWVLSRTPREVGPNATLISTNIEAFLRNLKDQQSGEIDVAGPILAGHLTSLGLIDEYRLYIRPVVLGTGSPFFTGPVPPLRLASSDLVIGDMIRLTYVPA